MADRPALAVLLAAALALAGCSQDGTAAPSGEPSAVEDVSGDTATVDQRFPDIVAATLVPQGDGTFDVEVTVSSPYDTPERYADGWRVLTPSGDVLGEHMLAHDHANEQPFTRTQRALVVPDYVVEVVVEGRDQRFGYGGETVVVVVPR